jgi:twitching motility protein PilT
MMDSKTFVNLLALAVQTGASDVHLQVGNAPGVRLRGELMNVTMPALTDDDIQSVIGFVIKDPTEREKIKSLRDFDGSFEIPKLARFRVNIMKTQGRYGVVLRVVPLLVPTIESLGLPSALKKIAAMQRGLVLVTGVTGSGKSSTLAAMIDYLNTIFPLHILTVEDPIEFVHTAKRSRVTQREVGRDTDSFSLALRAALRQDPDVILVGEMRDQETIDIALKAAETGHMVLSTVHTTDAIKTIGRLVSVFPPAEQKMVRQRLSENLAATISQRLIPRLDKKGMVAGQEVMINNTAIAECIANPDLTGGMNEYIEKSYEEDGSGGRTFEQHLVELYMNKMISLDSAKEFASNANDLERNLLYGGKNQEAPKMGDQIELDRPRSADKDTDVDETDEVA